MEPEENGGEVNCKQQHSTETLLRQPIFRRWMQAEWIYDDAEHNFFHKSNTFKTLLDQCLPKLRTHHLTTCEWHKIRRMFIQGKCRRFSAKFIEQTRIALSQYRQRCRILAENPHYIDNEQWSAVNPVDLCRLMVAIKYLLADKLNIIAKLKEINGAATISHTNEVDIDSTILIEILTQLHSLNDQIADHLEKLACYPAAQKALLFDVIDKRIVTLHLSPEHFRHFCAVHIYEFYAENLGIAATDEVFLSIRSLLDISLELVSTVIDQRLMGNSSREFFYSLLTEHYVQLHIILIEDDVEYFQLNCLIFLNSMLGNGDI